VDGETVSVTVAYALYPAGVALMSKVAVTAGTAAVLMLVMGALMDIVPNVSSCRSSSSSRRGNDDGRRREMELWRRLMAQSSSSARAVPEFGAKHGAFGVSKVRGVILEAVVRPGLTSGGVGVARRPRHRNIGA
jgi:hypothetical protein